jgi:hypothetical protein
MEDQLKNLNADSLLSPEDMNRLVELLGQNSVSLGGGNSKKKSKMTPQAKNFLLNQLSSHQKIQEVYKPISDMTEQEKVAYRQELKSRLHNKKNMFKQNRSNHALLQNKLEAQTKKLSTAPTKEQEQEQEQEQQQEVPVEQQKVPVEQQQQVPVEQESEPKLEDFVN